MLCWLHSNKLTWMKSNGTELSFNFISPACQTESSCRHSPMPLFSTLYSSSGSPPPVSSLTSGCGHAFRLNSASSLHLLPLPIGSDAGRRFPPLTSLKQPVKTSSDCCQHGPALSHHSSPGDEEADAERAGKGDVNVICKSPVGVL